MIKTIFWDFDGVILDSMDVRDYGFREIFKTYREPDVIRLIEYHRINGGLSRYVKIRYFFEEIINQSISEMEVLKYASSFSEIMRRELTKPGNLIQDSVDFISKNYDKYHFHIVSGSDQEELRFLCKELNISNFFISIHGSPIPKKTLVKNVLSEHKYNPKEACLIGDSINDYDAAKENGINFYGYNNENLKKLSSNYISSFDFIIERSFF